MKLKDISNLTRNKSNLQFSLNLKAKQLKKIGITPEHLLNLKLPKNFKSIKDNLKNIPIKMEMRQKTFPKEMEMKQKNIPIKMEMKNGNERR